MLMMYLMLQYHVMVPDNAEGILRYNGVVAALSMKTGKIVDAHAKLVT